MKSLHQHKTDCHFEQSAATLTACRTGKNLQTHTPCHSEGSAATRDLLLPVFFSFLTLILLPFNSHSAESEQLMATANKAYNEGMYDSALNVYHLVEKEQIESAGLYYNMGNAYFKNNDIASAILYYEKAKKLEPNNEDIEYNLRVANTRIVDKIETVPQLFFKNWWDYFYNMFNADTWTRLSLASWFILVFFVGLFILTKTRSARKLAFYFGLLFLISSVATFGLASQKYYFGKEHSEAIIFTPTITVKSSPTMNAVDLFVVHEGTKVRVMDELQEWVKIKIPDGSVGWLPVSTLREI